MDILENVKSALGSAAQSVVKKSGEVVGYSKIKYTIYDLNGEIKELYQKIGKKVYASFESDSPVDEEIKELCEKIKDKKEHLESLEEQLESYKSVVKCRNCGKSVKSECSYCPHCGEKLSVEAEAEFCSNGYYTASSTEPVDDEPDAPTAEE